MSDEGEVILSKEQLESMSKAEIESHLMDQEGYTPNEATYTANRVKARQ